MVFYATINDCVFSRLVTLGGGRGGVWGQEFLFCLLKKNPITKLIPYWLPFNYSTLWKFSLLLKCCFLLYNCLPMLWCVFFSCYRARLGKLESFTDFLMVFHTLSRLLQIPCARSSPCNLQAWMIISYAVYWGYVDLIR